MSMVSKAGTLLWFLRRPQLYREMIRRLRLGQISTKKRLEIIEEQRLRGRAWCEKNHKSVLECLDSAGLPPMEASLGPTLTEDIAEAKARAKRAGARMGGPGYLELIYHTCEATRAKTIVESGVAFGWSSLAALLWLRDAGAGQLYSCDMPYPKRGNEHLVGFVVPERLRKPWNLYKLPDRDALPIILKHCGPVDVVHYDSDKTYEGRAWALPRLYNALRPGGVLLMDDIDDNLAFRDFTDEIRVPPLVCQKPSSADYVGLLRKKPY